MKRLRACAVPTAHHPRCPKDTHADLFSSCYWSFAPVLFSVQTSEINCSFSGHGKALPQRSDPMVAHSYAVSMLQTDRSSFFIPMETVLTWPVGHHLLSSGFILIHSFLLPLEFAELGYRSLGGHF